MHFSRLLFQQSRLLRALLQQNASVSKNVSVVKVLSSNDDDSIKVSFRYSNSNNLNIKAPKDERVQMILSRIKLMAELQHKKEEILQSVAKTYGSSCPQVSVENSGDIDVCLIDHDALLDINIPNTMAWNQASVLKIGDVTYEIMYNTPTVTALSLPEYIVSGCAIRPHFLLENASFADSEFVWYRSLNKNDATELIESRKDDKLLFVDEKYWVKVQDGFVYHTSRIDAGNFLKVVCVPKLNDKTGPEFSVESKSVVEAAPEMFPFEERQKYTRTNCGADSMRCLSYNVLANVYVERRKFPYATRKARDVYYRKQILLKELLGFNSDIICLQEVQERIFEYDLLEVLKQFGFTGFYMRKGGHRHEGIATFFQLSKFKPIRNYGILLNQIIKEKHIYMDLLTKVAGNFKDMSKLLSQDTALQVLLLENVNNPEHKILVANTHLYSNKDMPEVRLIQAAICTYYVEHLVKKKNLDSVAILFCGDFNSLPNSATYNFMMSGNYECCPSWKNNSDDHSNDTMLRHNLCLDSACGTPEYTNYTEEFQGCLDYIFYSKNFLTVTEVVPMPGHEDVISQVGLPNEYFPSDHIPLVCTLNWKTS